MTHFCSNFALQLSLFFVSWESLFGDCRLQEGPEKLDCHVIMELLSSKIREKAQLADASFLNDNYTIMA